MAQPTQSSISSNNVPITAPNFSPNRKLGGFTVSGLAKPRKDLLPEHFVVKEKNNEPLSEGIPWKAFLVTSVHVEKQLKDHEETSFELLSSLGIAKALTNRSIFYQEDVKLARDQFLVLRLLEIVNPQPKMTMIKAKDWPSCGSGRIYKNRNVHIADETLGEVIRILANPGDLLVILGVTKFPQSDEDFGFAVLKNRLEKVAQSIIVFKRGENMTLSPITMPDMPRSLNVAERLTLSRFGQSIYEVTLPDPEPEFKTATKLTPAEKPEKKTRKSLML